MHGLHADVTSFLARNLVVACVTRW